VVHVEDQASQQLGKDHLQFNKYVLTVKDKELSSGIHACNTTYI
jgi:hypothetical protein